MTIIDERTPDLSFPLPHPDNFMGDDVLRLRAAITDIETAILAAQQAAADAITALVNASPAALDTLNELAAALGNDANFATTMTNALAAKAPLASPALTGTPTAPTPVPGTNTTQVATTAFIQAAIASLVASSPAALDTLNELAAALGNDANFATTMTNALAAKQDSDATLAALAALDIVSGDLLIGTGADQPGRLPKDADGKMMKLVAGLPAWVTAAIADISGLQIALDAKAPLASPELTGTPTAPTPVPGTNTTQVATTAFIQAAIASLVASSPAALDTLNELAAALGNDANFATTMTNALALKAPLASPALTGTPTAPTAAPGTNTTQVATTAFIQAAITALAISNYAKKLADANLDMNGYKIGKIKTADFGAGEVAATGTSGAVTCNFANGQKMKVVPTGAITSFALSFPGVGHYQLRIDMGTSYAITWTFSGVTAYQIDATAPTTAANKSTLINFFYTGEVCFYSRGQQA